MHNVLNCFFYLSQAIKWLSQDTETTTDVEVPYKLTIGMLVFQSLLFLTLQTYQITRVKGAMRAYLIFEFLSIFSVNVACFFRFRVQRNIRGIMYHHYQDIEVDIGDKVSIGNVDDLFLNNLMSQTLKRINDIFLTMRKSFILLIVYDAYNILCKPFKFQEYMRVKSITKRYLVAVMYSLASHVVHVIQMIALVVALVVNSSANGNFKMIRKTISDLFDLSSINITGHVVVLIAHLGMIAFSLKKCCAISKSLRDMNQNEFEKNPYCVTLYKMSIFLITVVVISDVVEIGLKTAFFSVIIPYEIEHWTEFGKAVFDSIFGITIMISFFIMFPRLRPGARAAAS